MNSITAINANPTAYRALADAFKAEETEALFALLGDGNMHWAASLTSLGVRGVYARHEHAACAMATMYARRTGKVGVASVTCGPGLTQIMTALATAVQARVPLVIFAGESPLDAAFYNQHIDQRPLVVATGAHYIAVHSLKRMTDCVREAFFKARTEQIPVVLGVPLDLQKQAMPAKTQYLPSSASIPNVGRMVPNDADVDRVVEAIRSSQRPVLVAGLGALQAGAVADCEALADACGAMLATTLPVRGMFDHHPFGIGISGGYAREAGRRLMQEADLLIAVGASLAHFTTDGAKLYGKARKIQIETRPLGLKHGRQAADIFLQADAREGVRAILDRLPKDIAHHGWRSDAVAREISGGPADGAVFPAQPDLIDPRDAVAAIDRVVPKDWEIVNSSGHCAYFAAQMRGRRPENFGVIRDFGAIGNGLSYAIGAAVGKPERTIVLIEGDGSLLMHAQELETVRRHGLKLLICILNDGAYGSEIHKMHADGISDEGGTFGRGDLAAIARGFGLRGRTLNSPEQFDQAFLDFQSAGAGAELWDIHIADNVTTPVMRAHMGH